MNGIFVGAVGGRFDPSKPGPRNRKGGEEASEAEDGWMVTSTGKMQHGGGPLSDGEYSIPWEGMPPTDGKTFWEPGDRIGVLVDLRPHRRSLAVYKNGARLGLAVPSGLQAPMRWAVSLFQEASVRLMKSVPLPPDVSDAQHEEEARKTKERVANDPTMSSLGFAHPENA